MSVISPPVPEVSDATILAGVSEWANERVGTGPRFGAKLVGRRPSLYQSSCAIEEVVIENDRGQRETLLLKVVSPAAWLEGARLVRPICLYDSTREFEVYRNLLPSTTLESAELVAGSSEDGEDTGWLLLEKVDALPLTKVGEFACWRQVARQLAVMHSEFARARPTAETHLPLVVCDEQFHQTWIDRAEEFLTSSPTVEVSHAKLVLDEARRTAPVVSALPNAIIHGEFYAANILVADHLPEPRVCPIDWETCALGSPMLDLAALTSGTWTNDKRNALVEEYRSTLELLAPQLLPDDFAEVLRICRLHQAIRWLGWSPYWNPPDEHRHDWLREAFSQATPDCACPY